MPGQPKPNGSGPQRVCDSCYTNIPLDKAKRDEEERQRRQKKMLTEAMQAQGLTTEEQAQLIAEGVTTVEIFSKIPDDQFGRSGIDIAARRKAAGAVLCVEGAGDADINGYYKQDGAPAPLPPSVMMMKVMIICTRAHMLARYRAPFVLTACVPAKPLSSVHRRHGGRQAAVHPR